MLCSTDLIWTCPSSPCPQHSSCNPGGPVGGPVGGPACSCSAPTGLAPPLLCPQYSVYIFAGLTGVAGALLTRRACNRGTSFRLPVLVLVVAAAAVLASLGLGIYQVKGAAFVLFRSSCCLGRRVRRLPHLVAATCCCLFAHSSPGNQTLPPSNAAEQERGAAQPLVVLPAVRTGELTTCWQ